MRMAARLTSKFALLLEADMYRRLHEEAGRQMISVGELVRRYVGAGLDADDAGRQAAGE